MQIIKKAKLINKLGLHARAAIALTNVANRFVSDIQVDYKNTSADAKDILTVMALGAPCGATLEIKAQGNDASDAVNAIKMLIQSRFGESE